MEAFKIHKTEYPDIFNSAFKYQPRPEDIFLVSYPKCGAQWLSHIIALIFRQGEVMDGSFKMTQITPIIENVGCKFVENLARPFAIRTHLPFEMIPWSDNAKYIYLTRNPKDCCVSLYHMLKCTSIFEFNETFDEFFESFLAGKTPTGDYFDFLLSWYPHRNDPNALIITFEGLKEDLDSNILKIASFIDDEKYAEPIRKNPDILDKIKKYSSLEEMSKFFREKGCEFAKKSIEDIKKYEVCQFTKLCLIKERTLNDYEHTDKNLTASLVRKGVVGDWKNYFSDDQNHRLEEKFREKFGSDYTELMKLWKKID